MTLRVGREERNRNWKDDGKKREERRGEDGRRCKDWTIKRGDGTREKWMTRG